MLTTPKTRTSHAWIGLSARVVHALQRQAERRRLQRLAAHQAVDAIDTGLTTAEHHNQAA